MTNASLRRETSEDLRAIRAQLAKQRGMSQEDLAEACGLSRNYISDIERGVRNPGLLVMVALAKALKVPLRELVEEIEPRTR